MKRLANTTIASLVFVLLATPAADAGNLMCRLPLLKRTGVCQENAQLKCRVNSMQGEIAHLQTTLADREAVIKDQQDSIAQMTSALQDRDAMIADLQAQLAATAKQLDAAEQQNQELTAQRDKERSEHEQAAAALTEDLKKARQNNRRVQNQLQQANEELTSTKEQRTILPEHGVTPFRQ